MKILIVIPARFKSSRLPGKPLKKIYGKELIIRVLEACKPLINKNIHMVVATDNKKIFDLVNYFKFQALMTSKGCLTGTDRVAEVAKKIKWGGEGIQVETNNGTITSKDANGVSDAGTHDTGNNNAPISGLADSGTPALPYDAGTLPMYEVAHSNPTQCFNCTDWNNPTSCGAASSGCPASNSTGNGQDRVGLTWVVQLKKLLTARIAKVWQASHSLGELFNNTLKVFISMIKKNWLTFTFIFIV